MRFLRPGLALGALLALLLVLAPVAAAAVTVTLRIEGKDKTQFEGPVTTDVRTVDGHDGTGAHTCDGTNGGAGGAPAPTAGTALATASDAGGFTWIGQWSNGQQDFLLSDVNGEAPDFSVDQTFWGFYVNGQFASKGMCGTRVAPGDEVLFAVGTGTEQLLKLTGPASANRGEAVPVTVTDESNGTPAAGASVNGATTGSDGRATVSFDQTGNQTVKATKPGAIRSNALTVCVHNGDDGTCGTTAPPPPPVVVPALSGSIRSVAEQQRFAHGKGPRELAGHVDPGPNGLLTVKLRLTRRSGGRCQYFSGRLAKLRDARCGRRFWFKIGDQADWSYLLPSRLPTGRYVLDVEAIDKAFHRDDTLQRGRNRIVFVVG